MRNYRILSSKSQSLKHIYAPCLLTFLIYFLTFFPQTVDSMGYTDTLVHIAAAKGMFSGTAPTIFMQYPVFFALAALFGKLFLNYSLGTSVLIGLMAALTCFLQIKFLSYFFFHNCSKLKIAVYGFALGFIWPLNLAGCGSPTELYLLSGATAPFHNATYLTSKPFALICFCLFYILLAPVTGENLHQLCQNTKRENRILLFFAAFFFISVLAKPNFYQIFARRAF